MIQHKEEYEQENNQEEDKEWEKNKLWFIDKNKCKIRYDDNISLDLLFSKYNKKTDTLMNKCYYNTFNFIKYPLVNIEYRGDGMGIMLIDNSKKFINDYDSWIIQLNQCFYYDIKDIKVNIYSWEEYQWGDNKWNEEEIAEMIYNELLPII